MTQRTERASILALGAGRHFISRRRGWQSERLGVPLLEAIVDTHSVKTDLPLYVCAARAAARRRTC